MPKAQGSLEYLLIAVAVFGMVIGAVLVMNSVLSAPSHQRDIELDKIDCGNSHIWLKQYFNAYNGTLDSAPGAISYYQAGEMPRAGTNTTPVTGETACLLQGKYKLNFSRADGKAWLQTSNPNEWVEYSSGGAAAGSVTLWLTDVGNGVTSNSYDGCGGDKKVVEPKIAPGTLLYFGNSSIGLPGGSAVATLHFCQYTITVANSTVNGTNATKGEWTHSYTITATNGPILLNVTKVNDWDTVQICGNGSDPAHKPKIVVS